MSENNQTIEKYLDFLDLVDHEAGLEYISYMRAVLLIGLDEGCSLTQLSEKLCSGLSTTSRIVGKLSRYPQGGPALELVRMEYHPREKRKKMLFLTNKGRALFNKIKDLDAIVGE